MTDGADFELQLPPPKRQRTVLISDAMESDSKQFWFQDGDIVLGVENKYLKLHRDKLMGSSVFSTMLDLPQPELTESFDGCPLVQLLDDALHDWIPVLNWMYNRSSFELQSTNLDIMARALEISTKYDISELRQWCKQQLYLRWPPNVVEMSTTAMPDAAEVVCLARKFDIPEILPAAFYALAVQRWANGSDGGRSHLILSLDDLRRLIIGREMLQERLTALLVNWDPHMNTKFFNLCRMCLPELMHWLQKLIPAPHSPYTSWLFHDLDQLSKNKPFRVCQTCKTTFDSAVDQFIAQLQDAIPKYFML